MGTIERRLFISCLNGLNFHQRMALDESQLPFDKYGAGMTDTIAHLVGRYAANRIDIAAATIRYHECIDYLERHGNAAVVFPEDPRYPWRLYEMSDPPYRLMVLGVLPSAEQVPITIVGTRDASKSAESAAFKLAFDAARDGLWIVSGFARGIDLNAHTGAVSAHGRTMAILGCGLEDSWASRSTIRQAILANGGCLLSEYTMNDLPLPWRFVQRNRLLAAISPLVVVVQAPIRSGALITAQFALDEGREVAVHQVGLTDVIGAGTRALHEAGAPVIVDYASLRVILSIDD
jgi:DNA processing protein